MNTQAPLSDSEWELMKVLWQIAPCRAIQLSEQLPQWHPKTVRTMLLRLQKKGVIGHEVHNGVQHFHPLLSREECESRATESFIKRVFDGALSPMVAHFTKQQDLTDEDRVALMKLIKASEKRGKK